MAAKIITVEANSFDEARKQIKSQVPTGYQVLSERVISDGEPRTVRALAETTEAAYSRVHIPDTAEVIEKKELIPPGQEARITVEAFDREKAELDARNAVGKNAIVKTMKTVGTGRKGFLGFGAKPNKYEAVVLRGASVKVTFRPKVEIAAKIDTIGPTVGMSAAELISLLGEPQSRSTGAEILGGYKKIMGDVSALMGMQYWSFTLYDIVLDDGRAMSIYTRGWYR